MKRIIVGLTVGLLLSLLAGCDSGGDSGGLTGVNITCSEVRNDPNGCQSSAKPVNGVTVVDGGTVSRSQMIYFIATITNNTPDTYVGYFQRYLDANCNGEVTPMLVGTGYPAPVAPGGSLTINDGMMCGPAAGPGIPLGARVDTLNIYGPDPAVPIDTYEVHFTLVE